MKVWAIDCERVEDKTWSVTIPESAYNITFNRLNADMDTQWNSWSAGGRDSNNAYYADGAEYGHWEIFESENEEDYFQAGDIVYLDLTDFTAWENDGALLYVNFSAASKEDNGGSDINIISADECLYNPVLTDYIEENHVYAYIISKSEVMVKENKLVQISSVKLPEEMFDEFKNTWGVDNDTSEIVFDEEESKVWLIW